MATNEGHAVRIEGKRHCGNIRLQLDWPGEASDIRLRACIDPDALPVRRIHGSRICLS